MTAIKLLVLSDSHGDVGTMIDVVEKERPDEIIHLGDHLQDAEELSYAYPEIPISMVPGNYDFRVGIKEVQTLERQGVTILMAHGHQWRVKSGPALAIEIARETGAQVLLYGHTHEAVCWQDDGMWIMNPGTVGGRRARAGYGVIELTKKEIQCEIIYL